MDLATLGSELRGNSQELRGAFEQKVVRGQKNHQRLVVHADVAPNGVAVSHSMVGRKPLAIDAVVNQCDLFRLNSMQADEIVGDHFRQRDKRLVAVAPSCVLPSPMTVKVAMS